jgi:hypothetical protein
LPGQGLILLLGCGIVKRGIAIALRRASLTPTALRSTMLKSLYRRKAMPKHRRSFVGLLIAVFVVGGVVATTLAKDRISDAKIVRWVEKTVAERQPPADDKRFDEIGWVTDIRTAITLGKENNRPIYLMTVDGQVNTGRC